MSIELVNSRHRLDKKKYIKRTEQRKIASKAITAQAESYK